MAKWKKGQSGNPHGRPKQGRAFAEVARSQLTIKEKIALVKAAIAAAKQGDIKALIWLRDTADGRPLQRQEISGPGGGPMELDLHDARERLATKLADLAERRGQAARDRGAE